MRRGFLVSMRHPLTWFVIGLIGFASLAPWAEAASSSRTVQVLIIIPERHTGSHRAAPVLPELVDPSLLPTTPTTPHATETLRHLPDGTLARTYTQFQL